MSYPGRFCRGDKTDVEATPLLRRLLHVLRTPPAFPPLALPALLLAGLTLHSCQSSAKTPLLLSPPPIDSNGKHACLQRRRSERRRQEPPPDPVSRQTVPPLWRRAETAHPPAPLPFRNTSSSSSSSSTCRRLYTKEGSCLCPAATPDRKGQDTSALCSSWSGTESRLGSPGPLNRVSISCFPPALSSCGTGSKAEQPAQKGTQPRGRGER